MPYAIIKIDTGEIVRRYSNLPAAFDVQIDNTNRRIISPVAVGDEGLGYRFIEVVEVNFNRPGVYFTQGSDSEVMSGNTLTITRTWVPWTQQEIDTYETARKDEIASQLSVSDDIIAATVLVILDEFNAHSTVLSNIFAATAAATSLADFKTRMAAITTIPQRTSAQIKAAIRSKLNR